MLRPLRRLSRVAWLALLGLLAGCGGDGVVVRRGVVGGVSDERATLEGSGSTLLAPLMVEWARLYRNAAPGVAVDYAAVGSDAGIARLSTGGDDFAISEIALDPRELRAVGGADSVIQSPVAGGAVVLAYNLNGVDDLQLSADALAGIFSGRITSWNDPVIRAANPGRTLPSSTVTPVYRGDPAGTTVVFTEYLRQIATRWPLGVARAVGFPRGVAATGVDGVASAVRRTPGAIGYTSSVAARRSGITVAAVENRAGRFVTPTPGAVMAALDGGTGADAGLAVVVPPRLPGPAVYPIVAFSHLVFRLRPPSGAEPTAEATALVNFAGWILTEGQRSAESVGFYPLPYSLLLRSYEALKAGSTTPLERK